MKQEYTLPIADLELLQDVDTRWDSVYGMLERALPVRPVSNIVSSHSSHRVPYFLLSRL
jgi:hypothetical protein